MCIDGVESFHCYKLCVLWFRLQWYPFLHLKGKILPIFHLYCFELNCRQNDAKFSFVEDFDCHAPHSYSKLLLFHASSFRSCFVSYSYEENYLFFRPFGVEGFTSRSVSFCGWSHKVQRPETYHLIYCKQRRLFVKLSKAVWHRVWIIGWVHIIKHNASYYILHKYVIYYYYYQKFHKFRSVVFPNLLFGILTRDPVLLYNLSRHWLFACL